MVKELIESAELLCNRLSILSMFSCMDELGHLQNVVGFPVSLCIPLVVRVVVMQVEAEIVGQRFEPAGEIVDMRETAEFHLHRAGIAGLHVRSLWMVVVSAVTEVVGVVVVSGMRDDVRRV